MAGYFEAFDYDKNEIVTLKEVRLNILKALGNRRGIYSNPYNCINRKSYCLNLVISSLETKI